jgi:probable HAF family extracellular repeat protein
MRDLNAGYGKANAVNDAGQVAGEHGAAPGKFNPFTAFRWQAGRVDEIPTLGGSYNVAAGINASGVVVGSSPTAQGQTHAYRWNGTLTDLGVAVSNGSSLAYAVDSTGAAVGAGEVDASGSFHALRFRGPGQIDDLGALADAEHRMAGWALAYAVNDAGVVVGSSVSPGVSNDRGFYDVNGTMTDAGAIPGRTNSELVAVNASGMAAGFSSDEYSANSVAVLYAGGTLYDLNTLADPSPWVVQRATGIDDAGDVVGWGVLQSDNQTQHALLLRPH